MAVRERICPCCGTSISGTLQDANTRKYGKMAAKFGIKQGGKFIAGTGATQAGAVIGASIGSIIPVVGTYVGAFVGAATAKIATDAAVDSIVDSAEEKYWEKKYKFTCPSCGCTFESDDLDDVRIISDTYDDKVRYLIPPYPDEPTKPQLPETDLQVYELDKLKETLFWMVEIALLPMIVLVPLYMLAWILCIFTFTLVDFTGTVGGWIGNCFLWDLAAVLFVLLGFGLYSLYQYSEKIKSYNYYAKYHYKSDMIEYETDMISYRRQCEIVSLKRNAFLQKPYIERVKCLRRHSGLHFHKTGYFHRNGSTWTEYLPFDQFGAWAYYTQISEDDRFYYIQNDFNQVAVPKSKDEYFYLLKNKEWQACYEPNITAKDRIKLAELNKSQSEELEREYADLDIVLPDDIVKQIEGIEVKRKFDPFGPVLIGLICLILIIFYSYSYF